jgi:23S rRNA (uracil1939-C5)-methyltransferase
MSLRAEAEVEIEEIGARGDGVAHLPDGTRVFVPYTVPGDRVRARLSAGDGEGVAGRAVEWLTRGEGRAEPPCRHFGECGGCALQHLAGDFYAAWKRSLVETALRRRGFEAPPVAPLVTAAPATRRRADFAAVRRKDDVLLGFHARASHRVVDLAECPVMEPPIAALLPPLRELLFALLRPSDKAGVTITATDSGLDVVLESPIALGAGGRERLAAFAQAQDLARLSRRHPNARGAETVVERRPARMSFGGVPVDLPAGAFLQATRAGEATLTAFVLDAMGDAPRVADLFSGCGTFSFPLAARRGVAASVHAVDGTEPAVAALARAAQQARLGRVTTLVRDLARRPLNDQELARFDAVVFDPPRAGAREQAEALALSRVPVVVAVSCNPATFARDARILVDGGYRLEWVKPVDQFLWSPHVELVARFAR